LPIYAPRDAGKGRLRAALSPAAELGRFSWRSGRLHWNRRRCWDDLNLLHLPNVRLTEIVLDDLHSGSGSEGVRGRMMDGKEQVLLSLILNAGRRNVTIAAVALVAQISYPMLTVYGRDYGQYEHVPDYIRDWFKALKNPRTEGNCCDESDCARTEARTHGNEWEARAPDGSWISIPADRVVHDQGNPTGEPVLCSYEGEEGWRVLCFVPGPGG
jgi:hypothetical protein